MNSDEISLRILEAHGSIMLGLYGEAEDIIDSLPFSYIRSGEVLRLRIMLCTALQKWGNGLELCRLLRGSHDPDQREAMGRFYLAYAEEVCLQGELKLARKWVATLSDVWPEGRELARKSEALAPLWK